MALLQQLADPHSQLFVIFLCIIQLDYTLNGDTIDLTYLQQLYKADGLFPTFNQAPIFTVFSQRLTEFSRVRPFISRILRNLAAASRTLGSMFLFNCSSFFSSF